MTDSRVRITSRKNARLNRKETFALFKYLVGNVDRLNDMHLDKDDLTKLVATETGLTLTWTIVRKTAIDADLKLKIKKGWSRGGGHIDATLGQLADLCCHLAAELEHEVPPLVLLAAQQWREQEDA